MSDLTMSEREELETLREFKIMYDLSIKDRDNPNVFLLEGYIDKSGGDGEYYATAVVNGVHTTYLSKAIDNFRCLAGSKKIVSMCFHVSSVPKNYYELESEMVKTYMGKLQTEFRHVYSDLTGYLWTDEKIDVGGHDILNEIVEISSKISESTNNRAWLVLRAEVNV
jgi:hypothetical protein